MFVYFMQLYIQQKLGPIEVKCTQIGLNLRPIWLGARMRNLLGNDWLGQTIESYTIQDTDIWISYFCILRPGSLDKGANPFFISKIISKVWKFTVAMSVFHFSQIVSRQKSVTLEPKIATNSKKKQLHY